MVGGMDNRQAGGPRFESKTIAIVVVILVFVAFGLPKMCSGIGSVDGGSQQSSSSAGAARAMTMPDCVGKHLDEVADWVKESGVKVSYEKTDGKRAHVFEEKNWRIDGQEPIAGTKLSKDDVVTFVVTNENDERYARERAEREAEKEAEKARREAEKAEREAEAARANEEREAAEREQYGGYTYSEINDVRFDIVMPKLEARFPNVDFPMLPNISVNDGVVYETGELDYERNGQKYRNRVYSLEYDMDGNIRSFICENAQQW